MTNYWNWLILLMLIGVDFDNTIVRYDALIHRIAVERQLIASSIPSDKDSIRNDLRRRGREDDWTELQGYIYGVAIQDAEPSDGVCEFFLQCRERGVATCIISHKTRTPFRGPQYDLHGAARDWLEQHGFFDSAVIGLPSDSVFLEETKHAKLKRIGQAKCSSFIDDLPEFLSESGFPAGVQRILYDPSRNHSQTDAYHHASTWADISKLILA